MILEVEGLKKAYGMVQAVRGIDFEVADGALFAFLGPNGAGKSTTIDMLCTLLRPDGGRVTLDGHLLGREDDAIRKAIGVVFQDSLLDRYLTVRENLITRGGFYGLRGAALKRAVAQAAAWTGVEELLDRPYGKLSGGQRRRADIARALVHTPRLLFLDEPTTGLDPQTRRNVWETVHGLQRQTGMTVFLTTHYMEEAAGADEVVVIDDGRVAARGAPDALRQRYASDKLRLMARDAGALRARLERRGTPFQEKAGVFTLPLSSTLDALPLLQAYEADLTGFEVVSGTLDDAFMGITGKEMRA